MINTCRNERLDHIMLNSNLHLPKNRHINLVQKNKIWVGMFPAMASDCEIHFANIDRKIAERLTLIAANETWRIQDKFSRYQDDSVISKINTSYQTPFKADIETAALINYAFQCYDISDGLFDITSGVLRKVWRFDGSDNIPTQSEIDQCLPLIGMDKIVWSDQRIQLKKGMEIDFGGIGKEYAVDKALQLCSQHYTCPMMVNFGGDIAANQPPEKNKAWQIGISTLENEKEARSLFELESGGIATSGDTSRFLLKDGIRYSHILNPKTGWSIHDAPHSVTVAANTCTDAGILATIASLQGSDAEGFLKSQEIIFSCQR